MGLCKSDKKIYILSHSNGCNFLFIYLFFRLFSDYYTLILKMAVNIKDLYGNSGNRFEKINTRRNFQKNTVYLIYLVSSCFLCGYFPDPLRFKRFPLSRVFTPFSLLVEINSG